MIAHLVLNYNHSLIPLFHTNSTSRNKTILLYYRQEFSKHGGYWKDNHVAELAS